MIENDPFHHHPELRGKIKPSAASFFRDMNLDEIDAQVAQAGFPPDWRTPCDIREADRRRVLAPYMDRDLWIFGYGSLMWDPAVDFAEVRQATCTGYQRSFCMWDDGARGSKQVPGLMLAMDEGGHCAGLAFRIPRDSIERETFVLFRREMILPVYRPVWLRLDTAAGPIDALTFVANRGHTDIRPGLPLAQQARMIARAEGMLGRNIDYLTDLYDHLELLGVEDPYVSDLHALTRAEQGPA